MLTQAPTRARDLNYTTPWGFANSFLFDPQPHTRNPQRLALYSHNHSSRPLAKNNCTRAQMSVNRK